MKRYFPTYFKEFSLFRTLLEQKEVKNVYSGVSFRLEPNIFETVTLFIGEEAYPILPEEDILCMYQEVHQVLFEHLMTYERRHLLQNCIDTSRLSSIEEYERFVETGEYKSEEIGTLHFHIKLYAQDFDDAISEVEWIKDFKTLLEPMHEETLLERKEKEQLLMNGLSFEYVIENETDEFQLEDWKREPLLRTRVLLNPSKNPNNDAKEELEAFFLREEAICYAKGHSLVSEYYSDFQEDKIAFNIKCYEEFVHEGLLEIGYATYEESQSNRDHAIECFVEDMMDYLSIDYGIAGRSGGYLVLTFEEFKKETIEYVAKAIEEALVETPKHYQELTMYEYDDILIYIEERREEEIEKENTDWLKHAADIVEEINTLQKERV